MHTKFWQEKPQGKMLLAIFKSSCKDYIEIECEGVGELDSTGSV